LHRTRFEKTKKKKEKIAEAELMAAGTSAR
jgi:hypothetical protein